MDKKRLFFLSVMLMLLVLVAGCTGRQTTSSNSDVGFHAKERFHFGTLKELVAEADLLVLARVVEVAPGRVTDMEGPESEWSRELNSTLIVEEYFKGFASSDELTVATPELAYARPIDDWRIPGKRVILALSIPSDGRIELITTNHSQSVFVVDGDRLVSVVDDELSKSIATLDLSDFRVEVKKTLAN